MTQEPQIGVQITGGTVTGAVAGGPNAIAVTKGPVTVTTGDEAVLARRLTELVAEHRAELTRPDLAERDAREVADELSRPSAERDRDRILHALQRIALRATAVLPVVTVVKEIEGLFH